MLSALVSGINSLLYSFLAFLLPLFFTVKALLRQFTVNIVAPTSFASAAVDNECGDDSEVPSSFIEAINDKSAKFTFNPAISSTSSPSSPASSSSSWLHYWAILSFVHCVTGIYERVILPFVGNSLLYHSAKYAGIYWLSKDDAKASRALWTAVIAPFVAKYEKDADRLVQVANQQGREFIAKSINSLRDFKSQAAVGKSSLKVE